MKPYIIYLVALISYIVCVAHRSSFGVVGVAAGEHFATGASIVSLFAVVQMLVYSLGQIPAGALSDRFGPRVVLAAGSLLMATGQAVIAFADVIAIGIFARALVAAGDACIFTPLARLVAAWFPTRQVPLMTQLCGMIGSSGQIISAVAFTSIFETSGWTTAFLSMTSFGVFAASLVYLVVRDAPPGSPNAPRVQPVAEIVTSIRHVLTNPGTVHAFFGHWITGQWLITFMLMWGYPYLSKAQGQSAAMIGLIYTIRLITAASSGVVFGYLTGRHRPWRARIVLGTSLLAALPWVVLGVLPGLAPLWLLFVLLIFQAMADAGSSVNFDIARTENRPDQTGTATGVAIMGGFVASLLCSALIGITIDLLGGDYTTANFRVAMSTQFILYALGLTGFFITKARLAKTRAAAGRSE